MAYRFLCLQSHYRKTLTFSWENLENAAGAYDKLISRIAALDPHNGSVDEAVLNQYVETFKAQLANDLNTSMAITALYDALKANTNDATRLAILDSYDQVLSLSLLAKAFNRRNETDSQVKITTGTIDYIIEGEGDSAIESLLLIRKEAKKAKDFARADQIRDELKAKGIVITDIPNGVRWKRV